MVASFAMQDVERTAANSPTPILDSGVLPPRVRRTTLRGVFVGFIPGLVGGYVLISVVGRQADKSLDPGLGALLFLFAVGLTITIHELGHLVAGWAVGFRFTFISIGPFSLSVEHGKLRVRIRREMPALGYAGMHVDTVCCLRRRMLIYIAAGPAANLLSVPTTVALINHVFPRLGDTWVAVPAAQFAVFSLLASMLSLIPIESLLSNDGARIAMLFRSRGRARRWLSIAAIGNAYDNGTRAKKWKRTWLQAAASVHDTSIDAFYGNWLAYVSANDRKDALTAGGHLEKCLELARMLPPSTRDLVAQEAAVFSSWFLSDAPLADKWLAQVKKPGLMERLVRLRLDVALRSAHRDYEAVDRAWQDGLTFIETATAGTAQARLKESWLEWQAEIRERQAQLPKVLSDAT